MANGLILIHIHTQYANRRPKKVWRRVSSVQAVGVNIHNITHRASVIYNGKQLPVYLNNKSEWHGYPFGTEIEVTPIMW